MSSVLGETKKNTFYFVNYYEIKRNSQNFCCFFPLLQNTRT